ncbi:MAG: hypothetical protein MZU79_03175 [Anaerotruncus sp.]|nr:hypothetical protein [Anaerotruncus sp.]
MPPAPDRIVTMALFLSTSPGESSAEFYFVEIIAKSRQFAIDLFEENFTFIFIENGEGFIEICDLLGGQFKG